MSFARIDLGRFRVTLIQAGTLYEDGGCLFGVVPRTRWAQAMQPNEANLVALRFNCYVVETGEHTVLIETGGGVKTDASADRTAGAMVATQALPDLLQAAGIEPASVDIVINSHLHWDHSSGNTVSRNGMTKPAFPDAKYYTPKGEFEHAREMHVRDGISYLPGNFVPLVRSGHMVLTQGDHEPVPGIRMCRAPGHNRDMNVVLAESEGRTFCFFSDLVPTVSHLMPTWVAAFDLFPMEVIDSKTDWLSRAASGGWVCGFGHDPKIAFAGVNHRFEPCNPVRI